jgi:hypothetical protein
LVSSATVSKEKFSTNCISRPRNEQADTSQRGVQFFSRFHQKTLNCDTLPRRQHASQTQIVAVRITARTRLANARSLCRIMMMPAWSWCARNVSYGGSKSSYPGFFSLDFQAFSFFIYWWKYWPSCSVTCPNLLIHVSKTTGKVSCPISSKIWGIALFKPYRPGMSYSVNFRLI